MCKNSALFLPRKTIEKSAGAVILFALFWQQPALQSQSNTAPHVHGNEYYAAPNGYGRACLQHSPCSLEVALSRNSTPVRAGDTLWLKGGTYHGTFTSYLQGQPFAPILVRQMPGERAILDGGDSDGHGILTIVGNYTWFWGFEIMSSDQHRASASTGSDPTDIPRGEGVVFDQIPGHGIGTKLINLVIHDTRQGVSFWKEAEDSEIYGCIIFNNGWDGPAGDRGHGHGIYMQNETGTKKVADNIIFNQFGYGIHAYGSSTAFLDNLYVAGNIVFGNGTASAFGDARNVLIGGGSVAHNVTFINNSTYGEVTKFGYGAPAKQLMLKGNYLVTGANTLELSASDVTIEDNTFVGKVSGFSAADYRENTFLAGRPPRTHAAVVPNTYEPGRANIVVYNWRLANQVEVDLSAILKPGASFQIIDAENLFGSPIIAGRYTGAPVLIPMLKLRTVTQPIGHPVAVAHTGPVFGAFVLLPGSSRPEMMP
jgi:Right handed beta helix region